MGRTETVKPFFFFGGEQTNQALFLLFRVTEKTVCSGKLHFLAVESLLGSFSFDANGEATFNFVLHTMSSDRFRKG